LPVSFPVQIIYRIVSYRKSVSDPCSIATCREMLHSLSHDLSSNKSATSRTSGARACMTVTRRGGGTLSESVWNCIRPTMHLRCALTHTYTRLYPSIHPSHKLRVLTTMAGRNS